LLCLFPISAIAADLPEGFGLAGKYRHDEGLSSSPAAFGVRSMFNPVVADFPLHREPSTLQTAMPDIDPFMQAAIDEAKRGLAEGGIPIGSALMRDGQLLASGHNKRVQNDDPMTHAETDCLRNAGRIGSYRGCTLYSTLMPCYFCSGAAVQFGIRRVIVGESRNFAGGPDFMRQHGIEVIDLDLPECYEMMAKFIKENPRLWNEDIGMD
jgi:creatinine deaminase